MAVRPDQRVARADARARKSEDRGCCHKRNLPANQEVQEEQHRQDVSQRADFFKLSSSNFQADVREQAEGDAFTDTEC